VSLDQSSWDTSDAAAGVRSVGHTVDGRDTEEHCDGLLLLGVDPPSPDLPYQLQVQDLVGSGQRTPGPSKRSHISTFAPAHNVGSNATTIP
jgi:hypothetical protein